MKHSALQVEFNLDPGIKNSFFIKSRDQARSAFKEVFPESLEYASRHFAPPDSTTLSIIITGISIGAGMVVTEMLKECGKDLWKAVKKLILPKERQISTESLHLYDKDKLRLEIRINDFSMAETLSGLDQNSESELKEFLTNQLLKMYEAYCTKNGS